MLSTALRKLIWLYAAQQRQGGGGTETTVTGTLPLTVANAVSHSILSLTRYGLCTQDGTPTPDSPADIPCNNGVLTYGPMGSNLFDPFNDRINVGYYIAPADGTETAATTNFLYEYYVPIEAGESYVFYGRRKSDNYISQYNRIHWYDAEKTYISTNSYTAGTVGKGVAPDNAVYARLSCNPRGTNIPITLEIVQGYDWTFCKGTEEVTPFEPFVGGVNPVGTPEVLTVNGKNLLDQSQNVALQCIGATGREYAVGPLYGHTAFIPVKPNTAYTWSGLGAVSAVAVYRGAMYSDASFGSFVSNITGPGGSTGTFTTTADTRFVVLNVQTAEETQQLELGSTATNYEPYVTPQTVTVPMLLGVGPDDRDEVELVHGPQTHRIELYVITGLEAWAENSTYSGTFYADCLPQAVKHPAMSLFTRYKGVDSSTAVAGMSNGTAKCGSSSNRQRIYIRDASCADADALKAKLAGFYAAGKPCIVAFALATETTEQTTAHHLSTHGGTNIVDSTANVGPVEAKVEYYAAA